MAVPRSDTGAIPVQRTEAAGTNILLDNKQACPRGADTTNRNNRTSKKHLTDSAVTATQIRAVPPPSETTRNG